MGRGTKVTISLPSETLIAVERERQSRRETRSEFFRYAVEQVLCQAREQEAIARYVQGYQQWPETEEEIVVADQAARASLAIEPWNEADQDDSVTPKE